MNVRLDARKKAQISNPHFASNKSLHVLMLHQYHGNNIYSNPAFSTALQCLCSPLIISMITLQLFLYVSPFPGASKGLSNNVRRVAAALATGYLSLVLTGKQFNP